MACSKPSASVSTHDFTFDLYKYVARQRHSENAFLSASSIEVVVAMMLLGARNNTEVQISRVLRLDKMDKEMLATEMESFVQRFKYGSRAVTLETANAIFPDKKNVVSKDYIKLIHKRFKADVKTMEYATKAEESRKEINRWVEDETHDKIKDLLPPGSLDDLTVFVVVNAIYFKGSWAKGFEESSTSKANFYVDDKKTVEVNMIKKKFKALRYTRSKELECRVIELPYADPEIGMFVVLPDEKDGLTGLEGQLTPTVLKNIMNSMYTDQVQVALPKFRLEASYQMKDILSALGMPDLFDKKKADLSGIHQGTYVSEVFHKTFVDVNEEGTEAAAASGGMATLCSKRRTPKFIADRPFMFLIWDHKLDVPLFVGRLVNPQENL